MVVAYYVRNVLMNMSGPLQTIFGLELVRDEQRATLTSLSAMLGSDAPLPLKRRGFSGNPGQCRGWLPTGASRPQDVPRGVDVAVE